MATKVDYFVIFLYSFGNQRTTAKPIGLPPLPHLSQTSHTHMAKPACGAWDSNTPNPPKPFLWKRNVFTTRPVLSPKALSSGNRLLNDSQIFKLSPIQFVWAAVYAILPRCSAEKSMASGAKLCGINFRFLPVWKVNFKSHFFRFLTSKMWGNSNTLYHKLL